MHEYTRRKFAKREIINVYTALSTTTCVEAASLLGMREVRLNDKAKRIGEQGAGGTLGKPHARFSEPVPLQSRLASMQLVREL